MFPKAVAHLGKFKTPDVAKPIITVILVLGVTVAATIDKYALASVLASSLITILLSWCVFRIPKKMPDLYNGNVAGRF